MNKITSAALLAFISFNCFAQNRGPGITMGNLPSTTINDTNKPVKTTTDKIIAVGTLTTSIPESSIMSYEVSILAGTDVWGPVNVKGAAFSPEIITRIKQTRGRNIKIFFDDIKVKVDGMPRKCNSVVLTYDQ